MSEFERFNRIIDRLHEMKCNVRIQDSGFGIRGDNTLTPDTRHLTPSLPPETLRDLDEFFREQIFGTDNELTSVERDAIQDYYIQTI